MSPSYNEVLFSLTDQSYQQSWPRYLNFWEESTAVNPTVSVKQAGVECIGFYEDAGTNTPESVMAVQLVQCMQSKGWVLKVEEVDLTS